MIEKLRLLQYRARIKLYRGDQLQSIDVAGRSIRLLRSGTGAPLLYLHSLLGESVWLPFHEALARSFSLIAPIHPGGEGSDAIDELDEIEDLVFHYLDLIAALSLDRLHLVGASFGGWIAAEFALRHPERVEKLVLVDPIGPIGLAREDAGDFSALLADQASLGERLFARRGSFFNDLLLPHGSDEAGRLRAIREAITRLGGRSSEKKLRARLGRISAPTLLLWGALDAIAPPARAQDFREAIPDARLTMIDKCGHLPMFEQEEKFVAAVTSFLRAG